VTESSDERGWVAETRFSGVIAELRAPRETVQRLLPPELRLAPGVGGGRTYPVLLMFGDQTGSAVHLGAMQIRTGVRFREVLFGVRCVFAASQAPVLFVPLMYCDEPVSRWSGNALYGFNKRAAAMEWLGASFVVTGEGGGMTLRAVTGTVGSSHHATSPFAEMASLPVLGRRRDGEYVTSRFAWDWATASVAAVRVMVAIEETPLPGFAPMCLFVSPRAAVGVRELGWRISWPEGGDSRSNRITCGHDQSRGFSSVLR
jgi:hypothetical protein